MQKFVIVVDMQRDFVMADGALSVDGAEALTAPAQAWLAALGPDEIAGVLFTYDTHTPEAFAGSPESEQFPLHCVRGSPGWQLVLDPDAIDRRIPVWRLEKHVFDMWHEPDITIHDARDPEAPGRARDAFFDALKKQGIEQVTVIGVAADYCVRWAIDGLVEHGFSVTVPEALTRGIERQIDAVIEAEFPGRGVAAA